ncbi:MAG: IS1595 family transposase [Alphaproteobacteria bacterium]|nr:IS1595 family transposase [Alphaproteobacteria bacterium]
MQLTSKIYNNENAARTHLEQIRWPNGVICPLCGCTDKIKSAVMKNKPTTKNPKPKAVKGYYHCGDCRQRFTVRTGTIYERSHIPLHKWVLATQLVCSSKKGMSAHQLHRMLGVTYKTAWFMAHRIREAMIDTNPAPLGGPGKTVQADETYIGKKEVKARTFHVDKANAYTVRNIIVTHASRESDLHTDESRLYVKVGEEFASHETVKHSAGEYVRGSVTTNHVENYFSIFKRGMKGVYQHCSEKHLGRYLVEFDFRFNHRDIADDERAIEAHKGAEGKRLTYRRIGETKPRKYHLKRWNGEK